MKKYSAAVWGFLILAGCSPRISTEEMSQMKPGFYAWVAGPVVKAAPEISENGEVCATPASCQKVVTALLAFKILGPDFCYETKILKDRASSASEDLVLCFSGDPSLTSDTLKSLVLKATGGKPLKGRLVLDISSFQVPFWSPGWMIEDIGTSYAAPVSSAVIDGNLVRVTVSGSSGQKVCVTNDAGYKIKANMVLSHKPSAVLVKWDGSMIRVEGNICPGEEKIFCLSPVDFQSFLVQKLACSGVCAPGQVVVDASGSWHKRNAQTLCRHFSPPLSDLMRPAIKSSNNLVLDVIWLTVLNNPGFPGPMTRWEEGDQRVHSLLEKFWGLNTRGAFFADGSGLARHNRLQPRLLWQILKKGLSVPGFLNIFPEPGEPESTLEKRTLLGKGLKAKTGHMAGISCLCGYRLNPSSSSAGAFAVMVSGFSPPGREVDLLTDRLVGNILPAH